MRKNIALISAAMLIGLIAMEVVARLWVPLPGAYPVEPGLLVLDQRGFWMPEPDYAGKMDNKIDYSDKNLTINPDGTRLVSCQQNPNAVTQRIYVLGDSQTFGFGLDDEETWPSRLQCLLSAADRTPAKIYNLGVHATNIDQYVRRGLLQVARVIKTGDLVIVGVTWNDLITNQADSIVDGARVIASKFVVDDGPLTSNMRTPVRRLGAPTWRYGFYQWSGILVPSFSSFKSFAESLTYSSALAHVAVPRLRLLYYRFRAEDSFVHKLKPGTVDNNMTLLSVLAKAIEKQGGHMVVYLLSNRLFFDNTYYHSYSAGGKSFPAQDYMTYLTGTRCTRFGLNCISTFDALKTPGPDTYTFPFDGHYNARGAKVVATHLYRYLADECNAGGHRCLRAAN